MSMIDEKCPDCGWPMSACSDPCGRIMKRSQVAGPRPQSSDEEGERGPTRAGLDDPTGPDMTSRAGVAMTRSAARQSRINP